MASKSKNEARIKDELECQQKWHEAYVKEKRKRDNRKSRIQKEIAKIEKRIYQYNEEKIKAQRNILNKKSAKFIQGRPALPHQIKHSVQKDTLYQR